MTGEDFQMFMLMLSAVQTKYGKKNLPDLFKKIRFWNERMRCNRFFSLMICIAGTRLQL